MLEVFEKSLCTVCLNLKCSCSKDKNKVEDKILNGDDSDENDIANGWIITTAKDTEIDPEVDAKKDPEIDPEKEKEPDPEEEDDVDLNDSIAPPASSLPTPKWDSPKKGENSSSTPEKEPVHPDIEAWMEAFRAEEKLIKEPIILQNLHYIDRQKKSQDIHTNGNAVDAFFKYFKMSNDTTVTYMSTRLATAYSTPTRKNYTYF